MPPTRASWLRFVVKFSFVTRQLVRRQLADCRIRLTRVRLLRREIKFTISDGSLHALRSSKPPVIPVR